MKLSINAIFIISLCLISPMAMAQATASQPCERGTGEAMDQARCTIFIQQQRIAQIQAQLDQMTVQYALTKNDLDIALKQLAVLPKKPDEKKPPKK